MKPRLPLFSMACGVLAGCSVGPDYQRANVLESGPLPANFSAAQTNSIAWKTAEPSANLPRGEWWAIFGDDQLDRLETLAGSANQSLAAAAAQLDQARALLGAARAGFYPQISGAPALVRQRSSFNAPQLGKAAGASYTYNTFAVPAELNWELDLWGRVRRQTEGARARFNAAADDLAAARLAVQAELAADYFALRALDAQHTLVTGTIEAYQRSLELVQNRRKGGIVSDLDVSQAESQLSAAQAELPGLELQRADLLHALAVLCGKPAMAFEVPTNGPLTENGFSIPASLPSELLERRPDIAAAERRMAAANADIGVAKAAFFPKIILSGLGGFESVSASTLFDWPSRMWALGPSVTVPLFEGGQLRAQLAANRAAYNETVANYRQTALTAFQEVEDQLAAQRLLGAQLEAQKNALRAARNTLDIANNRYKSGLVTYLEVATAQSAALATEQSVVQLEGQRLTAEVELIKALGGGWK